MAAKKRKSYRDDAQKEAEMNMTPMIDVVFLLIIFFLCIDFRILEAKLPAYLPDNLGGSPAPAEPQEMVRIKIVCDSWGTRTDRPFQQSRAPADRTYRLLAHQVHYTVGPKRIEDLDELTTELRRIYPEKLLTDPKTGEHKPIGVVIEPGTGATYGDVAPCVDAVISARFTDIHFGGGLGSRRTAASVDRPR